VTSPQAMLLVIADDFTGAADATVPFARLGFSTSVTTSLTAVDKLWDEAQVVGVDLGTRGVTPSLAYLATFSACEHAANARAVIFKKVDSQLRGNCAAELSGALEACPQAVAIVAPTLPAFRRVVRNGALEGPGIRSLSIQEVFGVQGQGSVCHLSLSELRCGGVTSKLSSLGGATVVLADAELGTDLTSLVEAAQAITRPTIWVGSAGLANAIAASLSSSHTLHKHPSPSRAPTAEESRALRTRSEACHRAAQEDASNCLSQQGDVSENRGILILVATREPIGTRQVTALAATTDAAVSQISIGQAAVSAWLKHELPTLRQRLANGGVVVLTLSPTDPDGSCEPEYAKFVVGAGLALRGTSQLLGLFATGGETARQLLDALGVRSARVITEIEPGMVELRTSPGGLRIVTKAGSFGTECSLIEAVNALRST